MLSSLKGCVKPVIPNDDTRDTFIRLHVSSGIKPGFQLRVAVK